MANAFLKINGETFYCHCWGSIFHQIGNPEDDIWKCNSCGEEYQESKT